MARPPVVSGLLVRALGLAASLVAGCGSGARAPADAAPGDGGGFASFAAFLAGLGTAPCGGTTTLAGTAPTGTFTGDLVAVRAFYGDQTGIGIYIGDDQSAWVVYELIYWTTPGAGQDLTPQGGAVNAFAINQATRDTVSLLSGTVDVTAASNPAVAADAGVSGQMTATATLSGDGFSLAGDIASPYCKIFDTEELPLDGGTDN